MGRPVTLELPRFRTGLHPTGFLSGKAVPTALGAPQVPVSVSTAPTAVHVSASQALDQPSVHAGQIPGVQSTAEAPLGSPQLHAAGAAPPPPTHPLASKPVDSDTIVNKRKRR